MEDLNVARHDGHHTSPRVEHFRFEGVGVGMYVHFDAVEESAVELVKEGSVCVVKRAVDDVLSTMVEEGLEDELEELLDVALNELVDELLDGVFDELEGIREMGVIPIPEEVLDP